MTTTMRQVVRDVLLEQAPHEIPLLDGTESLGDGRVTRMFASGGERTDPLGFGVTEVVALITPVVWLSVNEFVAHSTKTATDSLLSRLKTLVQRLRGRARPERRTVPPLNAQQLEAMHAQILERATAAGIDAKKAEAVADAVVSRMVRDQDSTPGSESTG